MKKFIYPTRDTTLYEQHEKRNAGSDQILQLYKTVPNVPDEDGIIYEGIFNSRILMTFNIPYLIGELNKGNISRSANYFLNLKATRATEQPIEYTLEARALSQNWENGRGYFNDYPEITEGASWKYRNGYYQGTGLEWSTGSISLGTTASFATKIGGGTWYTSSNYLSTYTFDYPSMPDVRIDVTDTIKAWVSGTIPNYGFIIKRTDIDEQSQDYIGPLNFFGVDTHTIYIPYLEASWDDSKFEYTSSISEIDRDFSIYIKNIRKEYKRNDKVVFRIGVRDSYPIQTYSTSSRYLLEKRLTTSSFYAIRDSVTENYIIPFDTGSTRISIDEKGSYFIFDMSTLLPERYYEILFRIDQTNNISNTYEDGFYFKVKR